MRARTGNPLALSVRLTFASQTTAAFMPQTVLKLGWAIARAA